MRMTHFSVVDTTRYCSACPFSCCSYCWNTSCGTCPTFIELTIGRKLPGTLFEGRNGVIPLPDSTNRDCWREIKCTDSD